MADDRYIDKFRATQNAKLSNMIGPDLTRTRHENRYDKATRISGERYRQEPDMKPQDESRPQFQNDARGPDYNNDTGHNWRHDQAERLPEFDSERGDRHLPAASTKGRGHRKS